MVMISEINIILIAQKNDPINYGPLISGIIGLFGVFLGYWLKEKNESTQEEYFALLTTKELLETIPIDEHNINVFYNTLRFNLRARKLRTYKLMVNALLNAKTNKDISKEKYEIDSRLENLKDGGIISRIIKKIKLVINFFNPYSR
jgi:hypothetical protein